MAEKSYPWLGIAPGDGPDSGRYYDREWWAIWAPMMRSAGLIVNSGIRTLAAWTNIGVFYGVDNKLEVTDGGGLTADVDSGAALVDGQFYYNTVSTTLTLPASKTNYQIVLRKNYSAFAYTDPGGKVVPAYSTRVCVIDDVSFTQDVARISYWDMPLATFTTDGAGITVLTDDREWVDAETKTYFVQWTASGTYATWAVVNNRGVWGFPLVDAVRDWALGATVVPGDFLEDFTVTPQLIEGSAPGAGNIELAVVVNYGSTGQLYNQHNDGASAVVAMPGVANTITVPSSHAVVLSTGPAVVGDYLSMYVDRNATLGTDTYGADVYTNGVLCSYLGWR